MNGDDFFVFGRREFIAGVAGVGGTAAAISGDAARGEAAETGERNEPETLTVAACQLLTGRDLVKNTSRIIERIEEAKGKGVDVVLFPEASLCGYVSDREHYESLGQERIAAAEREVIEASKRHDIAVIVGTADWAGGKLFNSQLVIDKGGRVKGRYSKTFLAESWPTNGRKLPVYEVAGVLSCFIICHDVRYPELVRLPAMAGAKVCYFSSHESGLKHPHKLSAYRAMPISRATENGIFLVMANAPWDAANEIGSHGNSKVIHPDGNVLQEADHHAETLVVQSIRIEEATRSIARRCESDPTLLRDWFERGVGLVVKEEVRSEKIEVRKAMKDEG